MDTDRRTRRTGWHALRTRLQEALSPQAYLSVPDYGPSASTSDREQWFRQFDRVRDLLEQTRQVVASGGWSGSGSWFLLRQPDGTTRPATLSESLALRAPSAPVAGACLVGIMVRLAEDPDRVPGVRDVWLATDELHEAMHERLGHDSASPGRAYPMHQRRQRLRSLTAWNDAPGRTEGDVLDLVDRAIARTIIGAAATPPGRE